LKEVSNKIYKLMDLAGVYVLESGTRKHHADV